MRATEAPPGGGEEGGKEGFKEGGFKEGFKEGVNWVFVWRATRRELRGSPRGFLAFFAALALATGMVAIALALGAGLREGLDREGRAILGGDVEARVIARTLDDDTWRALAAMAEGSSRITTLVAPAHANGASLLTEVKGVDAAWPLVGKVALAEAASLEAALARGSDGLWGVVMAPATLARLGVSVGDTIRLGATARFRVGAALLREPDATTGRMAFGPRVLASLEAVEAAGLMRPGGFFSSRYRLTARAGETAQALREAIRQHWPQETWRIRTWREVGGSLRRISQVAEAFFALAGFCALALGALAAAAATTAHMNTRREAIATLRALGATRKDALAVYGLQALLAAFAATCVGVALGAGAPSLLVWVFGEALPVPFQGGVYFVPLAVAWVSGMAATAAAATGPLARGARTQPAGLFRARVAAVATPLSWGERGFIALALAIAGAGACLAAPSWIIGLGFLALAATCGGFLWGVGTLTRLTAMRARRSQHFILAQLRASFARADGSAGIGMTALGVGCAALVAVASMNANLINFAKGAVDDSTPAFVFLGTPSDQADAFAATLGNLAGVGKVGRAPMLRGRVTHINNLAAADIPVAPDTAWVLESDRGLTWSNTQHPDWELAEGTWWDEASTETLVSVSLDEAQGLGINVGDTIGFEVLGRPIDARVANLRRVEWRSLALNFVFVFSPVALAGAPHSEIVSASVADADAAPVLRTMAQAFPDVAALDVRALLRAANNLFARFALATQFAALGVLLAGAIAMAAAIDAQRRARAEDAALLKAIGATRRRIFAAWMLEHAFVGAIAGLPGAAFGLIGGWLACRYVLNIDWTFASGAFFLALGLATILAPALALAPARAALKRSPSQLLRDIHA